MEVGFVGLGNMGGPMARNLLQAGHAVTAYNRSPARAEVLAAELARVAGELLADTGVEVVAFSTLARDLGIANAKQASAFCRAETAHDDIIYSMGWSWHQATRHLDKILDNAYARTHKACRRAEGLAEIDTSMNYPVNPYTGKTVNIWSR